MNAKARATDSQENEQLIEDLQQATRMLEAQLASIQADRGHPLSAAGVDASAAIESLEAQLNDLYAEREAAAPLQETIDGLNAQLDALYNELALLDGRSVTDTLLTVAGLEEQLLSIYGERDESAAAFADMQQRVLSLEAQVIALIDERDSLHRQVETTKATLDATKSKVTRMVSGLLEHCLD